MFLILHGYAASGPEHWQTWLAQELRAAGERVAYPELPAPFQPRLDPWSAALRQELAAFPTPPTVICHSLACILWLHHVANGPPLRATRVLLVAPCGPDTGIAELDDFFPAPRPFMSFAAPAGTRLVCSDDDPYCRGGAVALYAEPLRLAYDVLPGAGHINPESGYGPWPELLAWCQRREPLVAGSGAKNGVDT